VDYNTAYSQALSAGTGGGFNYIQDENDPELALLRRRAQFLGGQTRMRGSDELGRAGLLGSGVGMDFMSGIDRDNARGISDIESGLFARRRGEGLDIYNNELDWKRRMALTGFNSRLETMNQDRQGMMSALGGIGKFAGKAGLAYFGGPVGAGLAGMV
jgi:hypothetical protein